MKTARQIVKIVEEYFNLDPGTCFVRSNAELYSKHRNIVAYFLKMNSWEKEEIVKYFKMKRTFFYDSIQSVEDQINSNRIYRQQIAELKDLIFPEGENPEEEEVKITHVWLKKEEHDF